MNNDYLVVIPARLESTRLPRKLLMKINGKTVIFRTYQKALEALNDPNRIIIATDSKEIKEHCESFGAQTILTSKNCLTGTDRVAEISKKIIKSQYINLQGDEPIFPPDQLIKFIKNANKDTSKVHTAITKIKNEKEFNNISIPKMVFSESKRLLYSSRAGIPSNKLKGFKIGYKHVCVYAFNKTHLEIFKKNKGKTFFEKEEDLEINRFLELDINVNCIELEKCGKSLDTKDDLEYLTNHINSLETR